MTTTSNVILIKHKRTRSGTATYHWQLRWSDSAGIDRFKSIGRTDEVSHKAARKRLREFIAGLGSGAAAQDRPAKLTVVRFLEMDRDAMRSAWKPSTMML